MSAKELAVLRELRVGQGPVCGPCGVKAEVLEPGPASAGGARRVQIAVRLSGTGFILSRAKDSLSAFLRRAETKTRQACASLSSG